MPVPRPDPAALRAHPEAPNVLNPNDIREAARLIREGRLVAFPTETVYGLGANALDARAVRRIFEVKGRPATSPMIVHVASVEQARGLASSWPDAAERLAREHWPGPLTLVVSRAPHVPAEVAAGLPTVGLRMPAHDVALALLREAGVPIAAPSANRFTQLSPTEAAHVRRAFTVDEVPMVLDGGPCRVGIESTVVSLVSGDPVLLRPGDVTLPGVRRADAPVEGAHPSPGMHARHYQPRVPLLLVSGGRLPEGRGAYIWWSTPANAAHAVQLPADSRGFAARIYATLHDLDEQGWEWIAVERVPDGPEWEGVRDRLQRASVR